MKKKSNKVKGIRAWGIQRMGATYVNTGPFYTIRKNAEHTLDLYQLIRTYEVIQVSITPIITKKKGKKV